MLTITETGNAITAKGFVRMADLAERDELSDDEKNELYLMLDHYEGTSFSYSPQRIKELTEKGYLRAFEITIESPRVKVYNAFLRLGLTDEEGNPTEKGRETPIEQIPILLQVDSWRN